MEYYKLLLAKTHINFKIHSLLFAFLFFSLFFILSTHWVTVHLLQHPQLSKLTPPSFLPATLNNRQSLQWKEPMFTNST